MSIIYSIKLLAKLRPNARLLSLSPATTIYYFPAHRALAKPCWHAPPCRSYRPSAPPSKSLSLSSTPSPPIRNLLSQSAPSAHLITAPLALLLSAAPPNFFRARFRSPILAYSILMNFQNSTAMPSKHCVNLSKTTR